MPKILGSLSPGPRLWWPTIGEPANAPLVDVTIGVRAHIDGEYVIGTAEPEDSVAHAKTRKVKGDTCEGQVRRQRRRGVKPNCYQWPSRRACIGSKAARIRGACICVRSVRVDGARSQECKQP